MLYATLLAAAAALSGLVSAQSNETNANLPPGIQNCCTVDANLVPDDLKTSWCNAQRNTCPDLCGGLNDLAQGGQRCDEDTLEFSCECRNGTEPDLKQYQQTVPGQMCLFWFDQCINATNQNREFQNECINQRDANCGKETVADPDAASSSASTTPTPTGTGGGSQTSPSPTGASNSPSPTGAAQALVRDYSTPLLAGGLAAIFGLAL